MKRQKTILVHAVCRNCGTQLFGRYCHTCGQDVFVGAKRTVKKLIFNALENMFALDNKILSTLKYLIFYPGKLSLEYKNGRVCRYVHPFKLFWFITIIFFTILSLYIHKEQQRNNKDNTSKELVNNTESNNPGSKTKEIPEFENINEKELKNTKQSIEKVDMEDTDSDGKKEIEYLVSSISTYAPYVSFLLIPFFALLLVLFFRKKEYFYIEHLSFALHFHSFIFLLLGIYTGIKYYFQNFDYGGTFFLIIPAIYQTIALYVFYRPKRKRVLIWKMLWLNFFYLITVCIVTLAFIILVAIHQEWMNWDDF